MYKLVYPYSSQAFQSIGLEEGRFWIRMMIAGLTIVCLCSTLLEITLPLHRTVRIQLIIDATLIFYYCCKIT